MDVGLVQMLSLCGASGGFCKKRVAWMLVSCKYFLYDVHHLVANSGPHKV